MRGPLDLLHPEKRQQCISTSSSDKALINGGEKIRNYNEIIIIRLHYPGGIHPVCVLVYLVYDRPHGVSLNLPTFVSDQNNRMKVTCFLEMNTDVRLNLYETNNYALHIYSPLSRRFVRRTRTMDERSRQHSKFKEQKTNKIYIITKNRRS